MAVTERLRTLITRVRAVVRRRRGPGMTANGVAALLERDLTAEDLLLPEQCAPDPLRYRQHVLHVEADGSFSIVSLVWLPGQATPIHDHVSWCVVGVHRGREFETRYRIVPQNGVDALIEVGRSVNETGSSVALAPPGDIHAVANRGDGLAISLHVYGADIAKLGSSIRRCYDLPVRAAAVAERAEGRA